jgi:hypothetical protein
MERAVLNLMEFADVIALPGHEALFGPGGELLEETVHVRSGRFVNRPPDHVTIDVVPEAIDGPVLYLGHLPKKHFGHFILEGLGRAWAFLADPSTVRLEVLHHRKAFAPYEMELLRPLLGPMVRLRRIDRPLLLRDVLVPSQGVILGRPIATEMQAVYDRIRDALVGAPVRPTRRPLYLSRTRLPLRLRRTLGEPELEQRLARRGVAVFHPQEHPLEEQLRSVASARTVIGLEGSALHLTLFRDVEGARTVTLNPFTQEPTQAAIDELRGAESIHIHAQYPLHVRIPRWSGGPTLPLGPYRNFLLPRRVERQVTCRLEAPAGSF